jgi:hypothetical protein
MIDPRSCQSAVSSAAVFYHENDRFGSIAEELAMKKITSTAHRSPDMTARTAATGQTISRHETLVLSKRDRQIFFDTLICPPKPNARLGRAFRNERKHLAP